MLFLPSPKAPAFPRALSAQLIPSGIFLLVNLTYQQEAALCREQPGIPEFQTSPLSSHWTVCFCHLFRLQGHLCSPPFFWGGVTYGFLPSISPGCPPEHFPCFPCKQYKIEQNINPSALLYSLGSVRLLLRLPVLGGGERDCRETLSSSCEQPAWMALR